jgi:hypothetical protein
MALADSTFVIRASFPERRILGAILRSNVIQPILRVARDPAGVGRSTKCRLLVNLDSELLWHLSVLKKNAPFTPT